MRAIRAAHAFDGTWFLLGGATVVWEAGRIVGLEPGNATLPDGVEVRDHIGTVLPGLIDCHSHLVADATLGGLERAAAMSDDALDEVIAGSLAAHARAGLATVRDLGGAAAGIEHALAAGVDGIEHLTGLTADGPRIGDDLLEALAGKGVYVDLTMGNDQALRASMPAPPPPLAAFLAAMGVTSLDALYAFQARVLGRLREHGVTVVTGVNSGMAPPKQHGSVWRTVVDMVEAGYPAAEALAAATSVAARACGVQDDTGRLAAGLAADLLVVDGDLSRDVSMLGAPKDVVVRGVPGVSASASG